MNGSAYFLVGATASGKSTVAQYIAERQGQLIVSADSMNLYRGMDIGTAKPSAEERVKVDYAGIDIAGPIEKFSVAAYLEAVRPSFESGRDIIVAGGTGLYIKCLTEGFDDVPPENKELRDELETLDVEVLAKRARQGAPELYDRLTEDDRQNPRRLIRILEKNNGGMPSPASAPFYEGALAERSADREDAGPPHDVQIGKSAKSWNSGPKPTILGLQVEREELVRRIEQRVDQMFAAGLLDEARALIDLDLSPTALQAIGYAEAFAVLRNEMTLEDAREKTVIRTRQLAKRQMTWFRNQLNVHWIDTAMYPTIEELADGVCNAWKKTGPIQIHI